MEMNKQLFERAEAGVRRWIAEETVDAPSVNGALRSSELYAEYEHWAKGQDVPMLENRDWAAVLNEMGYRSVHKRGRLIRMLVIGKRNGKGSI